MFASLLFSLLLCAPQLAEPETATTLAPTVSAVDSLLIDELPADQAERLHAWLAELVRDNKVAGVSAQLVRDGKVIFRSVHGDLEKGSERKVAADSIFRIYSMTKPVTSVAVMQLVEQGKIDLDAPLSTYLPEWKDTTALGKDKEGKIVPVPVNKPVTTRHRPCGTGNRHAATPTRRTLDTPDCNAQGGPNAAGPHAALLNPRCQTARLRFRAGNRRARA